MRDAALKRPDGGQSRRPGRPFALNESHVEALRAIVREKPAASMQDITDALNARCGTTVCSVTVRRALRAAGIERLRPRPAAPTGRVAEGVKRYGYAALHRRKTSRGRQFDTSLTDAEWALVADLFERPEGGRGMPARIERRLLVGSSSAPMHGTNARADS